MTQSRLGAISAALVALFATACRSPRSAPESEPPFEVHVRATGDAEQPLSGVGLRVGKTEPVLTDADGAARLHLRGRTGDEREVHVACPEGYVSPSTPLRVTLYRVVPGAVPPASAVTCERRVRKVITAIRVDHGLRIPIVRFGHPIGATDAAGAGHVVVEGKPGEQIELTLDTSDAERRSLRPQSPTLSFVVPERDELLVLEQTFEDETAAPPRRASRAVKSRRTAPEAASTMPSRI
jgi:hypothetical protein